MTLNEAISLPSLQQKLEEGGYTSMEQLMAGTAKELASGTFCFCRGRLELTNLAAYLDRT